MFNEQIEMKVKTIILNNCKEKVDTKEVRSKSDLMFSPSTYSFNERQFDTMSLQLVEYINQNHGDAKPTRNK